jgi:hypothetical protein
MDENSHKYKWDNDDVASLLMTNPSYGQLGRYVVCTVDSIGTVRQFLESRDRLENCGGGWKGAVSAC